jgi:alpha-1,3-rhamnosyl/mannosyltransferase
MRVILNTLSVSGLRTGVGHYTAEVLRCLRAQTAPGEIGCFPGPMLRQAYAAWGWLSRTRGGRPGTPPPGTRPVEMIRPRTGLRRWVAGALRAPGRAIVASAFRTLCRLRRYDLYHEPNFIPLPCELPTVVTLHDLSVLLYPEWHPAERVEYYEQQFHRGLARCDHILAVSEFTRQEVIRHLGVSPQRITRARNGIRPGLRPLPPEEVAAGLHALGLPPRYLLCLGTIEPRKNVLTLLRAYCALPEAVRERYPLLLVGGWGWDVGPVAGYLDSEARHRGVRHLGYVPDEQLALLYNGARALAYPSLYEGFGLPPVEMLACGGAVLASTTGAVAETVGPHAHLIDPLDTDGWRDTLERVCTDDDWWRSLRQNAVEAAQPYTWEQCAADTLAVYRKVCGSSLPGRVAA